MQHWTSVARFSLVGAIALGVASCGASTKTQQGGFAQSSESDTADDSGKRLSGDFALSAVEDDYRLANTQNAPQTIFTFDEAGAFKRQDRSRVDEGTYFIGARGELVIYIEKVNGEPLAAARSERYLFNDSGGTTITLEAPSRKLTLQKH